MNWFDIGKLEVEENLSVGRFLDPFIIALTSYGALYFLGDIFKITAVFIWVSCSVLLIEELIHYYDHINFDLDFTDQRTFSENLAKRDQNSTTDY